MIDGLGRVRIVDSTDEAAEMLRWLGERRGALAVDVETTGLSPEEDSIRLCQFGDTDSGWAVPWRDWRGAAVDVLKRWRGEMVMHNARFDTSMLEADGIPIDRTRVHDTMVQSHLMDPRVSNSLKNSAMREFGRDAGKGARILKVVMKKGGWDWDTIPVEHPAYWGYGVLDTVLTARLHELWWPKVSTDYARAYDLEMGVAWVLLDMERRGVRVDPGYLQEQYARLEKVEDRLRECARDEHDLLNPTSNRQVAVALQRAGIELTVRTNDGSLSVAKDVLETIDHPLADLVLEIRQTRRNRVNYVGSLLDARDDDDIVRCSIWPFGAKTGRMSISDPPLQQIPRGSFVRRGFIPREGNRLIGCDWDQVELRLFAHFAQEQGMIDAIREGKDLHSYVTAMVYGLDTEDLDAVKRDHAPKRQITKGVQFGKIYGAGAEKIAKTAGVSLDEVEEFLTSYHAQFPGVERYMSEVVRMGKQRERTEGVAYINTWAGSRLMADEGKAYTLTNYQIQGTAAELLKVKLIELDNAGVGDHLVLPVHDEVLLDVPQDDTEEVARIVGQVMTETKEFSVPLTAQPQVGDNWAEVK